MNTKQGLAWGGCHCFTGINQNIGQTQIEPDLLTANVRKGITSLQRLSDFMAVHATVETFQSKLHVNLVVVLVIRLHQQRIINIFTALHDSSQNSWDISVNNSWCYTVVIHSRALNPMREKRWKYVIKRLLKQRAGKPNSVENAVCNCVSVLS